MTEVQAPFQRKIARARLALLAFLHGASLLWACPWTLSPQANAQSALPALPSLPAPSIAQEEVQGWIVKLGSESYSERIEAQRRLEALGTLALAQIRQATRNDDPQIASQARFLLQSNQLRWTWNNNPFETRKIVEAYQLAPLEAKRRHIKELNALDNNHGVAALCRISCYDSNELHSKLAALELLGRLNQRRIPGIASSPSLNAQLDPNTVQALLDSPDQDLTPAILQSTQGASSQASQWLALAFSNPEPFAALPWKRLLETEEKLLENASPETRLDVSVELTRWVSEQLLKNPQNRPEALQVARRIPPAILAGQGQQGPPDLDPLIEFAQWAIEAQLPELVQEQYLELHKLFPNTLPPILHYLLAESFARQDQPQIAQHIAQDALDRKSIVLNPDLTLPSDSTPADTPLLPNNDPQKGIQFRSLSADSQRLELAQRLIDLGLQDWAQLELRRVLEGKEDSPEMATLLALHHLSSSLHDQLRDDQAAKSLEKWVGRYETEKLFRMQVDEFQLDLASNYYLYRANDHAKKGNTDQAREDYFQSIHLASDNVDALIGLAQLTESPEQKRRRLMDQEQTISALRNEIEGMDRDLRLANPMFQAMEKKRLANSLNTLAWLLINTDADKQEALMLSRKSCNLAPEQSAYQDTLAHCLEKNGKNREAFRTQIKALSLEPNQLSLQRALVRFYQLAAKDLNNGPQIP
jgi:hypothetical protein